MKQLVIEAGSFEAAVTSVSFHHGVNEENASELVGDAMVTIVAEAPPAARGSIDTLMTWHRFNLAYHLAIANSDPKGSLEAQKALDAFMRGLH